MCVQARLRSYAERRQNLLSPAEEVQSFGHPETGRGVGIVRCVIDRGVGQSYFAAAAADTMFPNPDYIAESVDAFLTQHSKADYTGGHKDRDSVYLGFTFSFPVEQHALDKGKLLTWTKGFSAKNAVGKDVVELLQQAFDRKHMHVKCVALVNDVSFISLSSSSCKLTSSVDCGDSVEQSLCRWWCCDRCHLWDWNEWCLCREYG